MTREEIREKYRALVSEMVEDRLCTDAVSISRRFQELQHVCPHPYGEYNGDIGCWRCPDCGCKKG